MTEQPKVAPGPSIGFEQVPENVDASVRPEDGEQDVDQDANYEEAESDANDAGDDPEVHQVA